MTLRKVFVCGVAAAALATTAGCGDQEPAASSSEAKPAGEAPATAAAVNRVVGTAGRDILNGTAGADRFVYGPGSERDWIVDFKAEQGDVIELPKGVEYEILEHEGQVMVSVGPDDVLGLAAVPSAAFDKRWIVNGE